MTDILDTRAGFEHFERVEVPAWASDALSAAYLACSDATLKALLADLEGIKLYATCVEAHCRMHRSLTAGDILDAGLRVVALGTASVRFEVGLFHPGEEKPAASSHLALVIVSRQSGKPTPIPPDLHRRLQAMQGETPESQSEAVKNSTLTA